MTAMRTFTPTEDYAHYRVLLDVDRYDPDAGRSIQDVYAIGATSAKEIALDILYERGDRAASVLRIAELCAKCDHPLTAIGASPGHGEMGCRHQSADGNNVVTCGCKPKTWDDYAGADESELRYAAGDR